VILYIQAKVVDKNGITVPMGRPGEVWFKGYNVMPGYWNDEEMTKKAIDDDGWLKSGYLILIYYRNINYFSVWKNKIIFCVRFIVIF